ncbi:MAG: nucleotidyltransferase domain-containing protein [Desulfovermiculus sp.]
MPTFWADLAARFNLQIVYAFGSRAKEVAAWSGPPSPLPASASDVDIGVKPAPGYRLKPLEKVDIAQGIEDALGVPKVDLIVLPEADPFLAANIIRGERLYCTDTYLADEHELYILRRTGDLIPLERERIALIMGDT